MPKTTAKSTAATAAKPKAQTTSSPEPLFVTGLERSLAALSQLAAESVRNGDAVSSSVTAAVKGAEALGMQTVAFSNSLYESYVAQAKALGSARTIEDVVDVHAAFSKTATETLLAHVNATSKLFTGMVAESTRPLTERAKSLAVFPVA